MHNPPMFKKLWDLGYQRKGLEVPAFYISYLIGTIMAGAVIGVSISSLTHSDAIRTQWHTDYVSASIICLLLSHFMIKQKNLAHELKIIWILPLLAAILALFPGLPFGLLIPTILSTRPNKNLPQTPNQPNPTNPPQPNGQTSPGIPTK